MDQVVGQALATYRKMQLETPAAKAPLKAQGQTRTRAVAAGGSALAQSA
jgi:hypothetical protein